MRNFFARHRVASFVVGVVLALATGAAAAVTIYDLTATGTAPGNAITITQVHSPAMTFASNGVAPALDAASTSLVPVKLTNNDPNSAHVIGGGAPFTITDPTTPSCATHLSITQVTGIVSGTSVPIGGSQAGGVTVQADASLPVSCSGTTYTLTYSGTLTS